MSLGFLKKKFFETKITNDDMIVRFYKNTEKPWKRNLRKGHLSIYEGIVQYIACINCENQTNSKIISLWPAPSCGHLVVLGKKLITRRRKI